MTGPEQAPGPSSLGGRDAVKGGYRLLRQFELLGGPADDN